jgi:hypothetical protein
MGETIFVRTDCNNQSPLPADQQDPVYQKPGVALDRGTILSTIKSWEADSCDVSYQFFDDFFEVRGKDTSDNDLGDNGANLQNAISGCGDLKSWNFVYTPDDVTYQWYASGTLPIGTRSCVGSQLQGFGMPSAGNCVGAG